MRRLTASIGWPTGAAGAGDGRTGVVLAADARGRYDASVATVRDRVRGGAAGCDRLEELLDKLAMIDRLHAEAVADVAALNESGEAELVTQLPLELWLSFAGRLTSSDRRMLTDTARVLADMPAVRHAYRHGRLSWSQVRPLVVRLRDLRAEVRRAVDEGLAEILDEQLGWEPDELVWRIDRLVDAATPDLQEQEADAVERGSFLQLQPDLFGQHGRIYGEIDTPTLALFADRLDKIAASKPDADLPDASRDRLGDRPDATSTRESLSRRRARALRTWLFNPAVACPGDHDGAAGAPVELKLVMTLDSLLGRDGTPAELLTSLTGRRLKVSNGTARRLLDHHGTRLRGMIFDDTGQALGVGRQSYRPPGWLRDLLTVMFPAGIAPTRTTPAITADLDHHVRWTDAGPTDVDNLAPLARSDHRLKDSTLWQLHVLPDGTRRWTHTPTGIQIDKPPWTRQPKPPRLADLPSSSTRPRSRRRRGDPNAIPPATEPPPRIDDG